MSTECYCIDPDYPGLEDGSVVMRSFRAKDPDLARVIKDGRMVLPHTGSAGSR